MSNPKFTQRTHEAMQYIKSMTGDVRRQNAMLFDFISMLCGVKSSSPEIVSHEFNTTTIQLINYLGYNPRITAPEWADGWSLTEDRAVYFSMKGRESPDCRSGRIGRRNALKITGDDSYTWVFSSKDEQ